MPLEEEQHRLQQHLEGLFCWNKPQSAWHEPVESCSLNVLWSQRTAYRVAGLAVKVGNKLGKEVSTRSGRREVLKTAYKLSSNSWQTPELIVHMWCWNLRGTEAKQQLEGWKIWARISTVPITVQTEMRIQFSLSGLDKTSGFPLKPWKGHTLGGKGIFWTKRFFLGWKVKLNRPVLKKDKICQ